MLSPLSQTVYWVLEPVKRFWVNSTAPSTSLVGLDPPCKKLLTELTVTTTSPHLLEHSVDGLEESEVREVPGLREVLEVADVGGGVGRGQGEEGQETEPGMS